MKTVSLSQFCPVRFSTKGLKKLDREIRKFNRGVLKNQKLIVPSQDPRALEKWKDEATRNATVDFCLARQELVLHSSHVELGRVLSGHIITVDFEFSDFEYDVCEAGDL